MTTATLANVVTRLRTKSVAENLDAFEHGTSADSPPRPSVFHSEAWHQVIEKTYGHKLISLKIKPNNITENPLLIIYV